MLLVDCDCSLRKAPQRNAATTVAASGNDIVFAEGRRWTELNPPMLVHHHLSQIALAGPAINQADDECPHDRTLHLIRSRCRTRQFQDGFKVQGKWYRRSGKSFRRSGVRKTMEIERTVIRT
jgi:hypothetical protein